MRSSVLLTVAGLLGVILGAALIARWAVGLAVVGDSLALAAYGLLRESGGRPVPSVHEVPTLHQVLERAKGAA